MSQIAMEAEKENQVAENAEQAFSYDQWRAFVEQHYHHLFPYYHQHLHAYGFFPYDHYPYHYHHFHPYGYFPHPVYPVYPVVL